MTTNYYLPKKDNERAKWFNTFSIKLPSHATTVGISAAEVTAVQNDAAMYSYLVNIVDIFSTEKEERVNYKKLIGEGAIGTPAGTFPEMPTLPAVPTLVAPGIFPRTRKMIIRIKAHSNYNNAIGKDLGIIGAEQSIDISELKPTLVGKQAPKGALIIWDKGHAHGINIYVDRNDNKGFVFLATDTKPNYTDTFNIQNVIDAQAKLRTKGEPIPGAEITLEQEPKVKSLVFQYYGIYIINDEEVGKRSDVISVTVTV